MDTDQLSDYISSIFSSIILIFIFITLVLYIFGGISFKTNVFKDLEYFELGRTYNSPSKDNNYPLSSKTSTPSSSVEIFVHPTKVKKYTTKQTKKKPKVKTKKPVSPIENDCILALEAIGVKKSTAKSEVKAFFSNKNADTVEDFIREYLKK